MRSVRPVQLMLIVQTLLRWDQMSLLVLWVLRLVPVPVLLVQQMLVQLSPPGQMFLRMVHRSLPLLNRPLNLHEVQY